MSPRRELFVVAAWITACSFTSLDDLQGGEPTDASISDQCVGECLPNQGGTGGGTGGKDATSGGFGGNTGGIGGDSSLGGSAGTSDAGEEADVVVSPCVSDPNCQQCCVSTSGTGASEYVTAIHDCICALTFVCQIECASYCSTNVLDAVCTQCLGSSEVQQCLAVQCSSANCKAYTSCVGQC